MIQRFSFGHPFPTQSVVLSLPAESSPVPFLTPDDSGWRFTLSEQAAVYGLGEMPRGINKRGWHYITNNTDESRHSEDKLSFYGAHNFLLVRDGSTCFGLFVDFPGKVYYDIGYTRHDLFSFHTETPDYDLYLLSGENENAICKEFRTLIGRSYIPPRWAFGLAQSRWGYKTEEDVREVARQYKEHDLPLDMICMDIEYMQDYADFTVNKERFPDLAKLSADLKAQGIRLVPIIDAGVRVDPNDSTCTEGLEKGYFCKKADGTRRPPPRIISLGGLGEIGKNLTVFETEQDILVVDCGSAFPDDDLPGVDLVIPDFTYLEKNAAKVRGIFITHGHEDHIGSLPFLLKQIKAPVYATALTIGLISGKLKEHGILNQCKLNTVKPGDTIPAGTTMSVEFVRVNHSIPDACALAIRTPAGLIVHTGDFKVDFTPISGEPIDLVRFGELGSEGVLALLSDSTNAEKTGSTPSERIVGESFEKLFERAANKRIIIATFASNVHRIQQVVDTAVRFGRKVAVFGRSMVNVVAIAQELGYLTIPAGVLIDADNLKDYTDEEIVLITTGSQGEPMSALTRMSIGSHRNIKIGPNDCIIISATPIPGNEKSVGKVVNELMKLGADVIYERMYDVHVSGHACQDETRLLLSLTQPRFFMPMHGEYKHLMKNAGVGASMGIPAEHIIISDIGKVVETDGVDMKITGMVPSGRVLVDGLGVGDVGSVVLRDRKLLADDGLIVVVCAINDATGEVLAGPDLVSRGFVYVRDNEDLMADATVVVRNSLEKCKLNGFRDWATIKGRIRDELGDFIASRTPAVSRSSSPSSRKYNPHPPALSGGFLSKYLPLCSIIRKFTSISN